MAKFASRMSAKSANAPNAAIVLAYVAKFSDWYDWLPDASHPAYGARRVYVTNPMRHASGATVLRFHTRAPLHLVGSLGDRTDFTYDIQDRASEALETWGSLLIEYLNSALKLRDDFGLTTTAPKMTTRTYWRNFLPALP
ncbi:hypothetical protein MB46_00175 [Arthrobacter alpinus]|uniref:hypothetical protein n=1 Tax=Arthrobacter alpinus TaxID=656366 RepID=UPI0006788808|nr:hypothetical protein [Arthrobacter alpinus]ALV44164.1 hypothetical protein MB46_00175 [Arthrobacter alpinus]